MSPWINLSVLGTNMYWTFQKNVRSAQCNWALILWVLKISQPKLVNMLTNKKDCMFCYVCFFYFLFCLFIYGLLNRILLNKNKIGDLSYIQLHCVVSAVQYILKKSFALYTGLLCKKIWFIINLVLKNPTLNLDIY